MTDFASFFWYLLMTIYFAFLTMTILRGLLRIMPK